MLSLLSLYKTKPKAVYLSVFKHRVDITGSASDVRITGLKLEREEIDSGIPVSLTQGGARRKFLRSKKGLTAVDWKLVQSFRIEVSLLKKFEGGELIILSEDNMKLTNIPQNILRGNLLTPVEDEMLLAIDQKFMENWQRIYGD